LAHRERSVDETHYNKHQYLDERRHALERWNAQLRRIVSPTQDKVVNLRTAT
jgi:hypothetical protein